jgi:hypothetical protein
VLIVGLVHPERRLVLRWIPIPSLRGVLLMVTVPVLGLIGAGLAGLVREYGSRVRVFGLTRLTTNAVALITTAFVLGAFVIIERWAEARMEKLLLLGLDVGKLLLLGLDVGKLLLGFVVYLALLLVFTRPANPQRWARPTPTRVRRRGSEGKSSGPSVATGGSTHNQRSWRGGYSHKKSGGL